VLAVSKIENLEMVYSVERGKRIIVSDEMGTIYQIKPIYL
jgi:hypothetical protein